MIHSEVHEDRVFKANEIKRAFHLVCHTNNAGRLTFTYPERVEIPGMPQDFALWERPGPPWGQSEAPSVRIFSAAAGGEENNRG